MSDTKKPYTNLDLESAENALIRAGSPEIAPAMRQYTEGIRNYVQGEFGQSFINAVDSISQKQTKHILTEVAVTLDQLTGLVQTGITLARESKDIAGQSLAVSRANTAELGKLKKAVIVLKKGQTASDKQMAVVDKQLKAVIIQLEELGALAEKTNTLAEEQNRLVEEQNRLAAVANELTAIANDLALEVAELKVRIASVEARGG